MKDTINKFVVHFDFTTVHGSRFVGREGHVGIETKSTREQAYEDIQVLKNLCANYIWSQKPKWKILFITVKEIQPC